MEKHEVDGADRVTACVAALITGNVTGAFGCIRLGFDREIDGFSDDDAFTHQILQAALD